MTKLQTLILIASLVCVPLVVWWLRWLWLLSRSERRLAAGTAAIDRQFIEELPAQRSWLGWWLFQAGYRRSNAVTWFLVLSCLSALIASLVAVLIVKSEAVGLLEEITARYSRECWRGVFAFGVVKSLRCDCCFGCHPSDSGS